MVYSLPAGLVYRPYLIDLVENNHCVIAGSTGSGKSVLENNIIYSLLCTHYPGKPTNSENKGCKFVFIDPKKVELDIYKNLPHTLYYADNMPDIEQILIELRSIIDNRLETMKKNHLKQSNAAKIYVFIDELVDIMLSSRARFIVDQIKDIISISRACNVFFIFLTQAPNRKIIKPEIILNCNCRIALFCNNAIESRQIIGDDSAAGLPLHGRGIVQQNINRYYIDIPLISDDKINNIVRFWEQQKPKQHYF